MYLGDVGEQPADTVRGLRERLAGAAAVALGDHTALLAPEADGDARGVVHADVYPATANEEERSSSTQLDR